MLLLERPLDATDAWTAVRGVRWGQRGAFVAWGLPPQLRVGLDTKDFFALWYVLGDVEPVVRSVYTITYELSYVNSKSRPISAP